MNKLEKLLIYLEKEWTTVIANEFLDKLEEKLQTIKHNPTIGNVTLIKDTRSILITKHNKVYYRIEENKIADKLLSSRACFLFQLTKAIKGI